MKKFFYFAVLWAVCMLSFTTFAQDADVFYHTVERGQTVYSIATMYGVKVEEIYKLNIGADESIKVGDKLRIPQKKSAPSTAKETKSDGNYIYHTIQAKETLFGVSKKYGVSGEQIVKANPGLSQESFAAGKNIRIPTNVKKTQTTEVVETPKGAKEIYYTVPPKETMYNMCKKFKTNQKELLKLNPELAGGLRVGMTLRIPLRINEKDVNSESPEDEREVNALLNKKAKANLVNAAKVALLLPYNTQSTSANKRITEFYEGMLLAIDSLRHQGYSAEVFVYDIGESDTKTKNILNEKESELKKANLIIGGLTNEQIKLIADFAQKNKIKYVIPFTSKNDEVLNNAYIFQINTPQQYLFANAAYAAVKLFEKYNIIFLDTKDKDEQTEFVKELKNELKERNIIYKDAVYNQKNFEQSIKSVFDSKKQNVIIPLSKSLEALMKIKTVLRGIAEKSPEYQLTLFGYPDWQKPEYAKNCLEDFYALNTYIYSLFYADNMSSNVNKFLNNFKNWYNKNPQSSFPKYSMLGFDTGMYFFGAINKYGSNFETSLNKMQYKSVQTGFNFERVNNWGGFINTNVYIIHYNKNYTITRLDNFK